MPNTPPNDDLITEVLNQDPKYVDVRNQREGEFKEKHIPKKNLFAFKKPFWRNPLLLASMAASVLVVAVVGVFAFKNVQNASSNAISNENLSGAKIAQAPSPFLPLPSANQESAKSMLENNTSNSPNQAPSFDLNGKPSTGSSSLANSNADMPNTQNPTQTTQGAINKGNPAAVSAQTEVKSQDGSQLFFSYDPNRNQISYDGKISITDSCTVLESSVLENQNTSFTLKYKLKRTGEICAQVMGEIPLSGSLNVQLNQAQVDGFNKLFRIEKLN